MSSTLPHGLVVMGVSSSGKSTVAELFARRYGWEYRDGDSFHSAANVEKMRGGTPLTDEDRWPWLRSIADWLEESRKAGRRAVVSCSALKRVYRAMLVDGSPDEVRIVFLDGPRDLLAARMARRKNHYMPLSLLDSQLKTLERPTPDERVITLSIDGNPGAIVDALATTLVQETGQPLLPASADAPGTR
jgi:gluconokinase